MDLDFDDFSTLSLLNGEGKTCGRFPTMKSRHLKVSGVNRSIIAVHRVGQYGKCSMGSESHLKFDHSLFSIRIQRLMLINHIFIILIYIIKNENVIYIYF